MTFRNELLPCVSIIIPAFNEETTLGELIDRIRVLPESSQWEIIVVDDCSTDQTADVAMAKGVTVIRHPQNLGNGRSIVSGAEAARGEILVMMDADGQHDPADIPKLLAYIGPYDMVVGARAPGADVSRFRSVGNRVLGWVAQFLAEREIEDLTSGFRAIKKSHFFEYCHLFPQRYSYPTTITLAMLCGGHFVKYVPLPSIRRRAGGVSHLNPFRDGMRFLQIILRIIVLFNPMKIFLPPAIFFFLTGIVFGLYGAIMNHDVQETAVLLVLFGSLLFLSGIMTDQIAHIRREIATLRRESSMETSLSLPCHKDSHS